MNRMTAVVLLCLCGSSVFASDSSLNEPRRLPSPFAASADTTWPTGEVPGNLIALLEYNRRADVAPVATHRVASYDMAFVDYEQKESGCEVGCDGDEAVACEGCDGCGCWLCAAKNHKNVGFINLNYFWDERNANWFTVYSLAALPHDFTYFSLLNLVGQFDQSSKTEDLVDFYTEQNLWHPIAKNSELLQAFDWSIQWIDASFLDPILRLGVQWRVKDTAGPLGDFFTNVLDLDYRVYFHVIETDGSGIQIEHFYLRRFWDGQFYIRGFLDHDINKDGTSDFVSGAQMGWRIVNNLYLAAEHRYNSFQPPGNTSGWKLGFEYQIAFR